MATAVLMYCARNSAFAKRVHNLKKVEHPSVMADQGLALWCESITIIKHSFERNFDDLSNVRQALL